MILPLSDVLALPRSSRRRVLATLLAAVGCGGTPDADSLAAACEPAATLAGSGESHANLANAAAAAPATSGNGIAVIDDVGRTVRLAQPARRVVSLIPSLTELVLALDAGDRLVARTDFDTDPGLAHLPSAGQGLTPSLEWLAALRPDLVLAWPDQGSRAFVPRIEALGATVYTARPERIVDVVRGIGAVGTLMGLETRADSLAALLVAELRSIQQATASRQRPRVLYLVGLDPPRTVSAGTFAHELILASGGCNLFADLAAGWPEISLEAVVLRRPELIIVAQGESAFGGAVERLRRLPGWRDLEAITAGRVVELDPSFYNRPGPNLGRAARSLAELFHPGLQALAAP